MYKRKTSDEYRLRQYRFIEGKWETIARENTLVEACERLREYKKINQVA